MRGLLSYTINQGLPFPDEFLSKGFKEHLRLARNAETALLAIHYSIAEITEQVSRLNLESDIDFGEWIARLRGQRQGPENMFALHLLGFLDLSEYILYRQDFYGANFRKAKFEKTDLRGANLMGADFKGADLRRANFKGANVRGTDFIGADLTYTSKPL
ncbi:MAG: pentapeptide repeat-containing protein [Candidatus Electrothrix sp. YB6]